MSEVGWRQLREFRGVGVDGSFVLSWSYERGSLLLDVDVELRPEHPFYETPRRRGKSCMRPATVEFPWCTGLRVDGADAGEELSAAARHLPGGAITDLVRRDEGPYVLTGGFGTVEIAAERPMLKLQGS